ncbi:hypothetical protein ACOBR4_02430 [Gardnerella piotii]|uniref:hypothetical protein n=1 Tax=Gardnerella piotii TaxID=2792977 RepID=UPI003CFE77AE
MMNKKAIAAFAAGATLLAGFAMATPAFAADKAEAPKKEAEKELTGLEKAQKAVKELLRLLLPTTRIQSSQLTHLSLISAVLW